MSEIKIFDHVLKINGQLIECNSNTLSHFTSLGGDTMFRLGFFHVVWNPGVGERKLMPTRSTHELRGCQFAPRIFIIF